MIIKLEDNIDNDSLQIGDSAYFVPINNFNAVTANGINSSPDDPQPIGVITAISSDSITIENEVGIPSDGDFIMFQKDRVANNTSLLGYYAEVKLRNDSEEKAELFSLSSEVAPSSK